MFICYIFGSTGNDAAIWGVYNGIEANHIGEWSRHAPIIIIIVDSFTHDAQY